MLRNTGRLMALLFALLACVGCDQATKMVAQRQLADRPPMSFAGNLFRLHYAENAGGFFSFGANLSEEMRFWIFVVSVSTILLTCLVLLLRNYATWSLPLSFALALLIGGGFSNLLSRFLNEGHVVDFMIVGIGPLRTGTFNVADMAIMTGLGLLLIYGSRSPATPDPVTVMDESR